MLCHPVSLSTSSWATFGTIFWIVFNHLADDKWARLGRRHKFGGPFQLNHPKLFDKFFALKHFICRKKKIHFSNLSPQNVWLVTTTTGSLSDDKANGAKKESVIEMNATCDHQCNYAYGLHINRTQQIFKWIFHQDGDSKKIERTCGAPESVVRHKRIRSQWCLIEDEQQLQMK